MLVLILLLSMVGLRNAHEPIINANDSHLQVRQEGENSLNIVIDNHSHLSYDARSPTDSRL
jgi:hypothetical protein